MARSAIELVRLVYARATPVAPGAGGRLASARSKTQDPACSKAVSDWKRNGQTPEVAKQLAKCRAIAKAKGQATLQRAAGNEPRAQVLEHRAATGNVGVKARREQAKARRGELEAKRAARLERNGPAAAPAAPAAPKPARDRSPAAAAQRITSRVEALRERLKENPNDPAARKALERSRGRDLQAQKIAAQGGGAGAGKAPGLIGKFRAKRLKAEAENVPATAPAPAAPSAPAGAKPVSAPSVSERRMAPGRGTPERSQRARSLQGLRELYTKPKAHAWELDALKRHAEAMPPGPARDEALAHHAALAQQLEHQAHAERALERKGIYPSRFAGQDDKTSERLEAGQGFIRRSAHARQGQYEVMSPRRAAHAAAQEKPAEAPRKKPTTPVQAIYPKEGGKRPPFRAGNVPLAQATIGRSRAAVQEGLNRGTAQRRARQAERDEQARQEKAREAKPVEAPAAAASSPAPKPTAAHAMLSVQRRAASLAQQKAEKLSERAKQTKDPDLAEDAKHYATLAHAITSGQVGDAAFWQQAEASKWDLDHVLAAAHDLRQKAKNAPIPFAGGAVGGAPSKPAGAAQGGSAVLPMASSKPAGPKAPAAAQTAPSAPAKPGPRADLRLTPGQKPPALSDADFARHATRAAQSIPAHERVGNKVWIDQAHRAFAATPEGRGMSLDTFKDRLQRANHARHLDLSRADMPEAFPAERMKASATAHDINGVNVPDRFHFLRLPEQKGSGATSYGHSANVPGPAPQPAPQYGSTRFTAPTPAPSAAQHLAALRALHARAESGHATTHEINAHVAGLGKLTGPELRSLQREYLGAPIGTTKPKMLEAIAKKAHDAAQSGARVRGILGQSEPEEAAAPTPAPASDPRTQRSALEARRKALNTQILDHYRTTRKGNPALEAEAHGLTQQIEHLTDTIGDRAEREPLDARTRAHLDMAAARNAGFRGRRQGRA